MDTIIERFDELWAGSPRTQALMIVAAALIAAKVLDWLFVATLFVWTRKTRTDLDDLAARIFRAPIVLTVLLVGLGFATDRLALEEHVRLTTRNALVTIGILVWTRCVWRLGDLLLKIARGRADRFPLIETRTFPLFSNLKKVVLFAAATYAIIVVWDVDATGWLASAGIVGIALGFAAKDTLANLFAGVFVIADAPYRVGDFIVLGSGERGQVTNIGLRSTRIITRDDIEITIPNSVIASSMVTNETGGGDARRRVRVKVSVAYGSDIDQVRELLMDVAAREPMVCAEPAPRVRFRTFGASGLDFELMGWIEEPVLRGRAIDALNSAVYKRFNADGVEIPYEKLDVYVKERPPREA